MTNPLTPWDEIVQRLEKAEKFALEQGITQAEINQQMISELQDIWKEIQQLNANKTSNTKPFSWRE